MSDLRMEDFLCTGELSIIVAMQRICDNSRGILFVTDSERHLLGSLTDGDIRRWLVNGGNLTSIVSKVMFKTPSFVFENNRSNAFEIMRRKVITALPVLDSENRIISIIFASESEFSDKSREHKIQDVPVIIMAGGKGTRLYPYTKILPKPLIPVGDVPIIERIVKSFADFGVNDFYVTVNYKKGMIKSYLNDLGTDSALTYVEEEKPLGTAGSLKLIKKNFDKPVIVTNCDILINADYDDIYKHHLNSGNKLTIVSALKKTVIPYGVLNVGQNGVVETMEEKPCHSYYVNTGMYVLDADVIAEIPDNTFFHMTDLAAALMKSDRQVGIYPIDEDSFLDMGEFEEMKRMENKLLFNDGR